jgi:Holliday junction resolvasome RuvABC endonuclease subunit
MTHPALILGLDYSSAAIGWCVRNSHVVDRGVIRLDKKADISERCWSAQRAVEDLLMRHAVDAVALESPVARFAKAVIPQARISGVVLATLAQHSRAWCEVTPTAAKLALAEDGAATKREMLEAAAAHFGYDSATLVYRSRRDEWAAWLDGCGACEYSEHEADALGVALAAAGKVEVCNVV